MPPHLHVETPLWHSEPLSRAAATDVWLKMDCLQPVGSFKLRGVGRVCRAAVAAGARQLVTSSGGNAGHAVAFCGRALGVPVTVVVPRTTAELVRSRIRDLGATVLEHGDDWDGAHAHAKALATGRYARYVHPFDDPELWSGHASLIEECARQGPRPGVVVTVVGGGGLLCGILEGMHRVGWHDVPVVAVETEGAASFGAAVRAGKVVHLEAITSIATTLGARAVTPAVIDWLDRHAIAAITVTDRQAVEACLRFADDHRILVEPSCGAGLAAVYDRLPAVMDHGSILLEVCGGAGVSVDLLTQWSH